MGDIINVFLKLPAPLLETEKFLEPKANIEDEFAPLDNIVPLATY